MFEEKLKRLEKRYEELNEQMSRPEVVSNPPLFQQYAREHAELRKVVELYRTYQKVCREIDEVKQLLAEEKEEELRALAEEELEKLREQREQYTLELRRHLLPKDPHDERGVILEIRAGTGGEEAALFAADLFRMYTKYAEKMGWKVDILDSHPTGIGGFKEIIAAIDGKGVYSRLKFESGTHRVQRVPETEASGRIHTSAVTVAILPEAEEVEVEIKPEDLRIDVFRSSGPGGQSVNTTDSAVRITHLPTGLVVSCQDEKSQHKNKAKALKVLRARLLDQVEKEQQAKIAQERRIQVGSGDRSERIRTYNFPQGRVTDHRINLTLYKLESILEGELDELLDALQLADQSEKLRLVSVEGAQE
ncbi:MAG: peptide chain release factor 1 [Nitrospinota bacterium]|nr:MAG: peptide chain release factor 1 [Nitrospinota bacterium]